MIAPGAPFLQHLKRRWRPAEMATPPPLPEIAEPIPVEPYYALLINPFYPKDPAASFGKHVLTPSLALTSVTGTKIYWTDFRHSIRFPKLSASRFT